MFSVGLRYVLRGWFDLRLVYGWFTVGLGLIKLVQASFRVCSKDVSHNQNSVVKWSTQNHVKT